MANKRIGWLKEDAAKDDVEAEISRLAGEKKPSAGAQTRMIGEAPWTSVSQKSGQRICPPGWRRLRVRMCNERLQELRKDVGKPAGQKEKKADRKRKPDCSGDKRKPAAAEDQPIWFGKRKAIDEPRLHESSSSSRSSSRHQGRSKHERKERDDDKKKSHKKDKSRSHKDRDRAPRRVGDRGPFGTGAKFMFAPDKATSISWGEDDSASQGFQAAPSRKSKQLQLLEYAQKNPGRLASRLLTKMRTLLAREEGQSGHENLTPATATNYFLTVLLPLHRDKLNLRVQQEFRTIAKALDPIAMGAQEEAADVLAQRMKALELMVADQSWARAAHIELLPPEGATLVEPDESWVATREHIHESKLRACGKGKVSGRRPTEKEKPGKRKERARVRSGPAA